jgi:hypothetical protein
MRGRVSNSLERADVGLRAAAEVSQLRTQQRNTQGSLIHRQ